MKKTYSALSPIFLSLMAGSFLHAYTIQKNLISKEHFPELPPNQCYSGGVWSDYSKGGEQSFVKYATSRNDKILADISFVYDQSEKNRTAYDTAFVKKECSKMGGNIFYFVGESRFAESSYVSSATLRCVRLANTPRTATREELQAGLASQLDEQKRIDAYKQEIGATRWGGRFADFEKSHDLAWSPTRFSSQELSRFLGLRLEQPVADPKDSASWIYRDVRTGQRVTNREKLDRFQKYNAKLYVEFLKENISLYRDEYPKLMEIEKRYSGMAWWVYWPYLPKLNADGNIDYEAVKTVLLKHYLVISGPA